MGNTLIDLVIFTMEQCKIDERYVRINVVCAVNSRTLGSQHEIFYDLR